MPDGSVVSTYHKIGSHTFLDGVRNTVQNGCIGNGTANDRAALNTLANTTLQPNGGVIFFAAPYTYRISSNMTFPSNVALMFADGATLSIDTGVTVTINGVVDAGLHQVFSGLGTVALYQESSKEIYPNWWGSVGDDTDDTAALSKFDASASPKFIPLGIYKTSNNATQWTGPFSGYGQVKDSNGKRGKYFSAVKTAPSSFGNEDSINTAFDGDWSQVFFVHEHRITGASTAGSPATGYHYRPEIYPNYLFLYNESGHQESTSSNDGRTAIAGHRVKIEHHGQGDLIAFNFSAFCDSTKPGSTSWLANPAIVGINGDLQAGADGIYFNPDEMIMHDEGFDVAAAGVVRNFDRTNNTGAKYTVWWGYRAQSIGSKEVDVMYSAVGKANIGLDLSFLTQPAAGTYIKAAITLKADQRVYMNVSATDPSGIDRFPAALATDYFVYSSGLSGFNFVVGNNSVLQLTTAQVTAPVRISAEVGLQTKGAAPTVGAGYLGIGGSASVSGSANAGASGAVPAQVLGYLVMSLAGTTIKVPYFAA